MHMENVGLLGWLHTLACTAALVLGAWNILVFDRGRWHRLRGHIYAWSMIVANGLVFAIYRFDMNFRGPPGAGVFGFFHWLAIAALVFTLIGWFASFRQRHAAWNYVHPVAMLLGYYVLIGGLANELFARLDALRSLAITMVNGQARFGSAIVGQTQGALMLATFVLIVLFVLRVALRRHKRNAKRKTAPAAAMA
jgi:hypothetical protein